MKQLPIGLMNEMLDIHNYRILVITANSDQFWSMAELVKHYPRMGKRIQHMFKSTSTPYFSKLGVSVELSGKV